MSLNPPDESPYIAATLDVCISERDGSYEPKHYTLNTKTVEVRVKLITPDGEPAYDCSFSLLPLHGAANTGYRAYDVSLTSDDNGIAVASLYLLEPYIFRIEESREPSEYFAQEFTFQTDRRMVTIIVARSIFASIDEQRIVFLVDISGSMEAYLREIKIALNLALVHQFRGTDRFFNIVAFTDVQVEWQPSLVSSSPDNLQDALRFCETLNSGGGSSLLGGLTQAFRFAELDAVYVISDGRCESGDEFLKQTRTLYNAHSNRPRIHTVGINCMPNRLKFKTLQNLAVLTQGSFRPICLEQDRSGLLAMPLSRRAWGDDQGSQMMSEDDATGDEDVAELSHASA